MGGNRRTHVGAGFREAVARCSVTHHLLRWQLSPWWRSSDPQSSGGLQSADRKGGDGRPSQALSHRLSGWRLSISLPYFFSLSVLCLFGHQVQWEAELAGDEEENKAALLSGDVWQMGTLTCFSSFIYIHNPAWNVDYSFIPGRSPAATPGSHRCEFPFGGCTGSGRGGLVSPEVSFMTFSDF